MDSSSLKTASAYVNNLLLARGLLRDGEAINLARPAKGKGGVDATMARVINLVHDLILKRDHDQSHTESLAQTLRSLRSSLTAASSQSERDSNRIAELERQLSLSQASERSAKTALRNAEATNRGLREEAARLKTTSAQIRASCTNDIRKRDIQIQRLKTHLMGQQRGNRGGVVGASITITPGQSGGMLGNGMNSTEGERIDVNDPAYELKQETTEFLTRLGQELSDENDNLIGLVRSTITTLRQVQGIPEPQGARSGHSQTDYLEDDVMNPSPTITQTLPTSYEVLATDMDSLLENLRNLLTNPNFVSIDEVEAREEEIGRLRAGWEKMESRFKNAITMMEGWRKRMPQGDDTVSIKLDELKMGLGLGMSTYGAPPVQTGDVDEDSESSMFNQDVDDIQLPSSEAEVPPAEDNLFNIRLEPRSSQQPLIESDGNTKPSPRKVAFATDTDLDPIKRMDENASDVEVVNSGPIKASDSREKVDRSRSRIPEPRARKTSKKRPSLSPHPEERSPKMTVQEKLDNAQAEAESVAIGLKAGGPRGKSNDDIGRSRASPKKTNISGRPKRRKSTLSPEELDALLGLD